MKLAQVINVHKIFIIIGSCLVRHYFMQILNSILKIKFFQSYYLKKYWGLFEQKSPQEIFQTVTLSLLKAFKVYVIIGLVT